MLYQSQSLVFLTNLVKYRKYMLVKNHLHQKTHYIILQSQGYFYTETNVGFYSVTVSVYNQYK
jgi:hypothetical protein